MVVTELPERRKSTRLVTILAGVAAHPAAWLHVFSHRDASPVAVRRRQLEAEVRSHEREPTELEANPEEVGRDHFAGDLLGSHPRGNLERISAEACDAARKVTDREAIVHCSYGDVPTWDYFWQLNIARTIGAHDVARLIGTDDPLSEELARRMWEGTEASAEMWRSMGVFRAPVAVSSYAAWRDRFLALTGRLP